MDASALLLLISGVGVAFGWQPMPDGSQRYEYIVQIEPEVAKTLAQGQSIPIVGDIPDEVQPVGRIRLMVGREAPPRQRLVTHLKPASDGSAETGGVELAQYNRYGDSRYTAAPAAQQPPAATPLVAAATGNPYTPGPSPPAAEPGGGTSWNNDQPPITPTESTPPSSAQLFGPQGSGPSAAGTSWNHSAPLQSATNAATDAAADAISRLGNDLQQAAQPAIERGLERIDGEVREAADSFGDRTRSLVNELREPLEQPRLPPDSEQTAVSATTSGGHAWNEDPAASEAGGASIPWNHQPNAAGPASTPQPSRGVDPWAGVPDPRSQTGRGAAGGQGDVPSLATRPLPFGGLGGDPAADGPAFPNVESPVADAPGSPGDGKSPVVRSDMLQQPADRPLEGNVAQPVAATQNPAATAAATPAAPATSTWGAAPQTAPPVPSVATPNAPATTTSTGTSAPAPRGNTVAVLVAWVLLSGSIAANLYLFWSYLDVRQKYRALVRKTARAVGSRFSAA